MTQERQDTLFDLAYAYRSTKLWQRLSEQEMFAVKLSDGRIGYICVLGKMGEHIALALYRGENALRGVSEMLAFEPADYGAEKLSLHDESEEARIMFGQSCLQCEFGDRNAPDEDTMTALRDYAGRKGKTFRGANAYAYFESYAPWQYPCPLEDEKDADDMALALRAAIEMAKHCGRDGDISLREVTVCAGTRELPARLEGEIPLMTPLADDSFAFGMIKIPKIPNEQYQAPLVTDDLHAFRVKRRKKAGQLQCGIITAPRRSIEEPDGKLYVINIFLAVWNESGMVAAALPFRYGSESDAEEIVRELLEELDKHCPREMLAWDARTRAFLTDICAKTGIELKESADISEFEEAAESMLHSFENDSLFDGDDEMLDEAMEKEIQNLFDMLRTMDESVLEILPSALYKQLRELDQEGLLPPDIKKIVKKYL